jgi:cytochrome c-type biogenesis protein CcmH
MTRRAGSVALAAAVVVAASALALVAVHASDAPRSLSERARTVASTIKCPVCQDLSVADSPSGVARQMRVIIEQDLRRGMTPDAIRQRFVASYGQWILLSPPRNGLSLVAWLGPALAILLGLGVAGSALRRWTSGDHDAAAAGSAEPDLSAEDRSLLERALAEEREP